jgi:hypothetical protein
MSSEYSTEHQNRRNGRRHRWMGTAAIGTLAFVALVTLLPPGTALAGPMTTTIRITAPYHGAMVSPSMTLSTSGCGSASLITAPFFHPHSGHAGFSGSAATGGCSPTLGGFGSAYEAFYVSVPINVIPGQDKIVAKWSLHVSGGTTFHLGKCKMPVQTNTSGYSYCSAYASSTLSAYSYIYDTTNGSYVAAPTTYWAGLSNTSSFFVTCYLGNCTTYTYGTPGSFSFNGPLTVVFHASGLLATHHYAMVANFYGSQYASQSSFGASLVHTHLSAWLNAGTFGNGLTLSSITIT